MEPIDEQGEKKERIFPRGKKRWGGKVNKRKVKYEIYHQSRGVFFTIYSSDK